MQTVFVAGSITIKRLPDAFVDRLKSLMGSGDLRVLIGDANGVDKLVQSVLAKGEATSVTVYCTGDVSRNNLGGWHEEHVRSEAEPGTRKYFVAKDLAMAAAADFGFMLWDCKSVGTLGNVVELTRRGKPSVVYVQPHDAFSIVKDFAGLRKLADLMSDEDRSSADGKIGLSQAIWGQQIDLPV